MSKIIEFKNIRKSFPGVVALKDVCFSIKDGEVHAIVGENGAGKSTLMKVLAGVCMQEKGDIIYKDKKVDINTPFKAREIGIATVYQELKLCLNLKVYENIFLGKEEKNYGLMVHEPMKQKAKKLLDLFGAKIDVNAVLKDLTIAEMQIVEIVKALNLDAEVIMFDEPTSSLTNEEVDNLFRKINELSNKGITIIFVSHKLDEIFSIADRISVLRDGDYLGTYIKNETSKEEIIKLVAGEKLYKEIKSSRNVNSQEVNRDKKVLEVDSLSRKNKFKNISFKLYEGETLGLYGLQGAGRSDLIETLYGLYTSDKGEISIFNENKEINNPKKAIENNLVLLTGDRKLSGGFFKMDVKENMVAMSLRKTSRFGVINNNMNSKLAKNYVKKLNIKVSDITQQFDKLSGGNQQKVLISRCLLTNPQILFLDEPSRGIDVGAKAEIYKIIRDLKKKRKSIILISSELPEIIAECDRVIVMKEGKITKKLNKKEVNKENILRYAL